MEAYTNIRIEMKNNEQAKEAVEKLTAVIKGSKWFKNDERNVSRLIEDITIDVDVIKVNDSCSLDSWEYENLIPLIYKSIAVIDDVKTFKAISHYECCNDGYEAYCHANYWNETLTIEDCASESFYGCCDECGEFIVRWEDYNPEENYICPDCGEVLTEARMFPDGVPTPRIETYEIW